MIGVEPSGANSMAMSLAQGKRVTLSRVDAFADGVAVKHVSAGGLTQLLWVQGTCRVIAHMRGGKRPCTHTHTHTAHRHTGTHGWMQLVFQEGCGHQELPVSVLLRWYFRHSSACMLVSSQLWAVLHHP